MKSFELIITILFVMVIWMVVGRGMPSYLVVPFLALWFVILFIGMDNLGQIPAFNLASGFGKYVKFPVFKKRNVVLEDLEVDDAVDDIKVERSTMENEPEPPKVFRDAPPPIPLTYDEYKYRENLFPESSCPGDYLIAEKMKHMGLQPKVSIDAQARVNKYTNYGYLAEELDSHANSIWWDDETLEDEF
jgi:hypothetical protein